MKTSPSLPFNITGVCLILNFVFLIPFLSLKKTCSFPDKSYQKALQFTEHEKREAFPFLACMGLLYGCWHPEASVMVPKQTSVCIPRGNPKGGLGPPPYSPSHLKCNVKQDSALSQTSSISNIDRNAGRRVVQDRHVEFVSLDVCKGIPSSQFNCRMEEFYFINQKESNLQQLGLFQ